MEIPVQVYGCANCKRERPSCSGRGKDVAWRQGGSPGEVADDTGGRARKAELELYERPPDQTGKTRRMRRLCFRTFLPTVDPIQWSKLYKRIELCPTERESND